MPKDRDRTWWRDRAEPAGPRDAPGGIKAHSRRGRFGETWWARRWLSVLEQLDLGGRLGRARAYARRGQVLDVTIEEGRATASVQGSRKDPYAVTIRVKPLSPAQWERVGVELREEARFAAKLLASEMPEDVEEAFARAGVSLFPRGKGELTTECSCPDWSNPCKHIAAVYYLLGEEFDRDPFLVFRLRGLSREGLVALLGSGTATTLRASPVERGRALGAVPGAPPLPADPAAFWTGGETPASEHVRVPDAAAALVRRLGPFPFWRGPAPLVQVLEPLYARASTRALDVYVGGARG
jgi:uncharacterized Zn finger protein